MSVSLLHPRSIAQTLSTSHLSIHLNIHPFNQSYIPSIIHCILTDFNGHTNLHLNNHIHILMGSPSRFEDHILIMGYIGCMTEKIVILSQDK